MKVESDKVEPSIPCGNSGWGWVEPASLHGLHPPAPCLFIASLVPLGIWVWDLLNAFFSLTRNVCCPHRQRPLGMSSGFATVFLSIFPLTPCMGWNPPNPLIQIITSPLLMPSGSLMFPTWPPSFANQVAVYMNGALWSCAVHNIHCHEH